jgi:hypothetical protein
MPKGPKGEKRPADVIGNAVKVMRIATGEEEDVTTPASAAATLALQLHFGFEVCLLGDCLMSSSPK